MSLQSRGFTLIELMIVMIITATLLGLGVAGFSGAQTQARDNERREDVAAIARGLENRYNLGNPVAISSDPSDAKKGSYPGVNEFIHINGGERDSYTPSMYPGGNYRTKVFQGTVDDNFTNPAGEFAWFTPCTEDCTESVSSGFYVQAAFADGEDRYVYEPYDVNDQICCCGNCVGYNLYWKSETDPTTTFGIKGLQIVRSKHQ